MSSKVLRCRNVVMGCPEVIRGETEDDVLRQIEQHLRDQHHTAPIPLDVVAAVKAAIRAEGTEESPLRSAGGAGAGVKDPVPENILAERDAEERALGDRAPQRATQVDVPENARAEQDADAQDAELEAADPDPFNA